MSRSGYVDDCDETWQWAFTIGRVKKATKGKRGQKMLKDLLVALDEMPVKRLIAHELEDECGQHCTLGVLGARRGLNMKDIDPEDSELVGATFDIAPSLASEIVFRNDEAFDCSSPEVRWEKMRAWVEKQIIPSDVKGG